MSTLTDDLGTQYFQLSTVGVGALAVGVEDLRQCIDLILRTIPGTDPLRPAFGCNAYRYNDASLQIAIPNVKKEIYQALALWEPRIEVVSIIHAIVNESQLAFNITFRIIDDDLLDSIIYSSGGTTTSATGNGQIIITAAIPPKFTNGIYRVSFIVDVNQVLPLNPTAGFENSVDMLAWINANWFNYGKWYITSTSLVLYMNSGIAKTVNLTVIETAQVTVKDLLPTLEPGDFYNLEFSVNGQAGAPTFPDDTINNIEALLAWVQSNWGEYGNWSILNGDTFYNETGDFNDDFNGDFLINRGIIVNTYLVFQTEKYNTAVLNFI